MISIVVSLFELASHHMSMMLFGADQDEEPS